jgi:magnesium chelatase subunit H
VFPSHRAEQELREVSDLATAAERQLAKQQAKAGSSSSGDAEPVVRYTGSGKMRVVLVSGFESFNVELYKQAAQQLARQAPHIELQVSRSRPEVL